jgi:hypothetical protein
MTNQGHLSGASDIIAASRVVTELATELAESTSKRYRIDAQDALRVIQDLWAKEDPLWHQAAQLLDGQRLKRTRAYKQAAERARTEIYYRLRRYRQDDDRLVGATKSLWRLAHALVPPNDPEVQAARDAIVQSHVSTRERLTDLDAFLSELFRLEPSISSIVDVGCGVQPLLYPFDGAGRSTSHYLGLDRDVKAVEAVTAWSALWDDDRRIAARLWSLAEGFDGVEGPGDDGLFDLALALKFVPVAARQERDHLVLMRHVPARRLLVTGAREAMVKRHSIARREEQTLRAFADAQGFSVVGMMQTPSELGLLLERC